MAVPKMSQLRPGVSVNMVLKSDQRSGRLTTGSISEILTRGDHPRGIKVRLNNGQVGRVQSLSVPSERSTNSILSVNAPSSRVSSEIYRTESGLSHSYFRGEGSSERGARHAPQLGYTQDPAPLESCSLADYIRNPVSSLPASASDNKIEVPTFQAQMESEFPKLDSALIAAILADYSDFTEAKSVLSALS